MKQVCHHQKGIGAYLSSHISGGAQGCSGQAMQGSWNGNDDAVVENLAKYDSCLLKGVGPMQGGAFGLILCKPLPIP